MMIENEAHPVRVLIVAPSLRYVGGQAIQAQRLLRYLQGEKWAIADFLPVDPVLPAPLDLLQRIKIVRTVVTSIAYLTSLVRTVPRYHVIHAFSASYWSFLLAPAPAILVARLLGKRVIVNYRSGEADDHLRRWGWHARPLLGLASLIVVPSMYLVQVFKQFKLAAEVVPNFLDLDQLPYRRRVVVRPRFLSNRNFEIHYNVAAVLRAFGEIQRVHPDAEMDVVGDGPLKVELHALASALKLRNVQFIGQVKPEGMAAFYEKNDIYLNSPTIDNMPNSVIEAFATGVPVVSSDAGGIPFIVRDGENGLLAPSGDADALARAALRLLSDSGLAVRLADQARAEAISRYSWGAARDGWKQAYSGVSDTAVAEAKQR